MKQSIGNIFKNLSNYLLIILLLSIFAISFIASDGLSFQKVKILNAQEKLVNDIMDLETIDLKTTMISFNAQSVELINKVSDLKDINQYDYINKFLLPKNAKEYEYDMAVLKNKIKIFNNKSNRFFSEYGKNSKKNSLNRKKMLDNYIALLNEIDLIKLHIQTNTMAKYYYFQKLAIIIFVLIIFVALWYRKKLNIIYEDILFLYNMNRITQKEHKIITDEVGTISLQMKRKPTSNNEKV